MSRFNQLICNSAKVVLALPILISFTNAKHAIAQEPSHEAHHVSAQLVRDVRRATERFLDVNNAGPAGYGPAFGCVTGPDHGAMGIHYVNGNNAGDAIIDPQAPEAVLYEPDANGQQHMVAVEYLVVKSAWDATHTSPPSLFGKTFDFTPSPNRFGLPPFYSLHAWIGKPNPAGTFAMFNPSVTCDPSGHGVSGMNGMNGMNSMAGMDGAYGSP